LKQAEEIAYSEGVARLGCEPDPRQWRVEDVVIWLRLCGLDEHVTAFRE